MNYDVFISYNTQDKQIADAICHYLEARTLRCFIAPRDIVPPDWAGSITRAIEHSQAFVIVVSEHAVQSNEVAKEITLATRVSNYIFPFRVDDSILDSRMTYHLAAFHWIDAVTPPMEQRLQELADRVCAALSSDGGQDSGEDITVASRNTLRRRLLGQRVSPRAEFSGRSGELEEMQARFDGGCRALFLYGMGGIGKSELAKAYARDHSADYSAVIFASYETDLIHMIANDQSVPVENLAQSSAAGGQGETLQAYYERKMKVLRSIVDEKTLIIIDNFDTEGDEHLEEVLQLPCRFLITTRTDFSPYGYETLKLGVMEHFDDLVGLFFRIDRTYSAPEDRQAVEDIIRLLDCHTYAVSLTAAQMKAGHIKPEKMLAQLREHGLNIQTRSTFARGVGTGKATAYQYIQTLFDFSALDETACAILRDLACVPREGVSVDLFMDCTGVGDFSDISRLIDLNWVQYDEENDRIGLHMLIRELVWDQIRPTTQSCAALLAGVRDRVWNAWNQHYSENARVEALVYSLMEHFPQPAPETLDIFEQYATFAWIMGNFDLAEVYEHRLFAMCEQSFGAASRQAGNQALRVAAVYHNMGDYARARPWYETGWRVLQEACGETHETCTACMKVGRSDAQNGDYSAAEEKYVHGLDVLNRLWETMDRSDPEETRAVNFKRGVGLMELAHVYACQDRGQEALPLVREARQALETDAQEPAAMVYVWMVMAYVYHTLKDYEQAKRYLDRALEDDLRFHSGANLDTMFLTEMQGDILTMQGRFGEAGESYAKALASRETHFPADSGAIERLEKKYACARAGRSAGMPFLEIWP